MRCAGRAAHKGDDQQENTRTQSIGAKALFGVNVLKLASY
jgi:hypothetical protein